ncbi:hypothetical protein [Chitinophaga ginsengisegetis]|uniref:hypothetical protein n=1 Tax=Chitinophaga ginsengisegetis TaxID=393003 RepID=UPI000DB9C3F6|nr:hypothetical protein [Chitinophaga ginsengisegetis]MDR6568824.1 hypothetical protein [Chitinophaga ginsengisegetis]MDR6647944.1 hypothetical protein [Chitinophaga ginsengisegetis]MDR6654905.1 hypothetical protein [Chitinophaga ginsengisegetis]
MDILKIIVQYIQNDRLEGALMINGEWGIGKSTYWREKIKPEIEKLQNPKTTKKYKCIYVSLNGIQKTDEIHNQIAIAKLPWIKNKASKITYSLGSAFLGIFLRLKSVEERIGSQSADAFQKMSLEDFLNFENCILCFDDLERLGGQLSIGEVLGYINTHFIETNKVKTMIIANENELKDEKNESSSGGRYDYLKIKEKTINRTLLFTESQVSLYELINQYKELSDFHSYISQHYDYLSKVISGSGHKNLRTIIFSLDIIHQIFNHRNRLAEEPSLSKSIILFSILISIEFKLGHINSTQLCFGPKLAALSEEINVLQARSEIITQKQQSIKSAEETEYAINFFNKYNISQRPEYVAFTSIFNFVLTGEITFDDLDREIELFYKNEEANKVLNGSQTKMSLLRRLNWANDFKDENDLCIAFNEMIRLITEGDLQYFYYPFAAETILNLYQKGLISEELPKFHAIFISGIKKSIIKYSEEKSEMIELHQERSGSSQIPEVDQLIKEEFDRVLSLEINKKVDKFFQVIEQTDDTKTEIKYDFIPLEFIKPDLFFDRIRHFNCMQWRRVEDYFSGILRSEYLISQNRDIKELNIELANLIEGLKNIETDKVKKYTLATVVNQIKHLISKLE